MNFLTLLFALFATYRVAEADLRLGDYPQCTGSSSNCFYYCITSQEKCDAIVFWTHTPGNNYVQFNISWAAAFWKAKWGAFGISNVLNKKKDSLIYVCLRPLVPGSIVATERFMVDTENSVRIEPVTTLTNGVKTNGDITEIDGVTSCVFNVYANRQVGDVQLDLSTPKYIFAAVSREHENTIDSEGFIWDVDWVFSNKMLFNGIAPPLVESAENPEANLTNPNYCSAEPRQCKKFRCNSQENCEAVILFWNHTPGNNYVQFNISWYDSYPTNKWGAFGITTYRRDRKRDIMYYVCFRTHVSLPTEYLASSSGSEPPVAIESVTSLTNGVKTLAGRYQRDGVTSCVFNVHANRVVAGVQFDLSTNLEIRAESDLVTNNEWAPGWFLGSFWVDEMYSRPLFPAVISTTPRPETITVTAEATHNVVSVIAQILTVVFAANVW